MSAPRRPEHPRSYVLRLLASSGATRRLEIEVLDTDLRRSRVSAELRAVVVAGIIAWELPR